MWDETDIFRVIRKATRKLTMILLFMIYKKISECETNKKSNAKIIEILFQRNSENLPVCVNNRVLIFLEGHSR